MVRTKVVSMDVDVGKNGAKAQIAQKYSPTQLRVRMWNKCLWVGGSCWGKQIKLELVNKAWAHKKTSTCKFSQSPSRKCLNQICVPLCPVTLPWGGKARHHWGSRRSKCQAATLYGSYTSLSNGKWNGTCTSCHRIVGMQLYIWGRQRLTWKDSRTSNVETQIQADANEMRIREGIGLGWSQGFGLD